MKSIPFAFMIVFCVAIWEFGSTNPVALSCDSCGQECARACGTRHFRSCCFNYVRKRTTAIHPYSLNQLRYDMLYRGFPHGDKIKSQNKNEEFNEKVRDDIANRHTFLQNENAVADIKSYFAPWKEEENNAQLKVAQTNEYDEHQKALDSELQPMGFFES